jgi:hypothetical protein
MHVAAIDMWYEHKGPNYTVYTRVAIVDQGDNPVASATVSVTTILPDGSEVARTMVTGDDGLGATSLRSRQTGTYVSTVTSVGKEGWVYNADANAETTETASVP